MAEASSLRTGRRANPTGSLGSGAGTSEGTKGETREARSRSKLLSKGCLILDVFETRASGSDDWDGELATRGYVTSARQWEGWSLSEADTVLRPHEIKLSKRVATCAGKSADGKQIKRKPTTRKDGQLTVGFLSGGKRVSIAKLERRSK